MLPDIANCGTCGAEIRWCRTHSGAAMPIDAKPTKVVVLRHVEGEGGSKAWIGDTVDGFTSHFATCPDAKSWRRQGPARSGG